MRTGGWAIAVSTAFLFALAADASATPPQSISVREAKQRVAAALQRSDALIQRFPKLLEIRSVVRADCASKNEGQTTESEFCSCASAVTMSLWVSGIDPQMVPRIQTFLNTPEASAEPFVAYQGPELYAPLCRRATER